jgi:hypothetical protein
LKLKKLSVKVSVLGLLRTLLILRVATK